MHEVLVNRLGGLSLPRKSVVRLTDRPDMTIDVYRGRKTTIQQLLIFYFLYLTRITKHNRTPHLKPPKNQNRRGTSGRPGIKLLGREGLQLVCGRPTLALTSALVPRTRGGRVVRWFWVNFQCRGVLLIWIIVG